jgi:hypothetical protein
MHVRFALEADKRQPTFWSLLDRLRKREQH